MKRNARLLVLFAAAIVAIVAAVLKSREESKSVETPARPEVAAEAAKDSPDGARHSRALMYLLR